MANIVTIEVRAQGAKALDSFKKSLISLAPAALPVAAGLSAVTAQAGAAAAATVAFGAAVGPQVKTASELAKSSGSMATSMSKIPPAARDAASSLVKLNNSYHAWSDSLAGDTMPVVTKSFQTMTAVLPHLSGMVEGAAVQLDRLMTVAGGGVASGAFGSLMKQFTNFSTGALKDFTDGVIHLARSMSEGSADGPIQKFIEYARANGPLVQDTLKNIARAVGNLLEGMSTAGPSMLTIVNALAQLVAAVPPSFLGVLMKLYTAFKLVSLAGSAFAALGGILGGVSASFTAMAASSAAAGGGLAGLRAAIAGLSATTKAAMLATGIGIIVVALSMLSEMGQKAPADVDKMTTSLNLLNQTGKVTGEAARVFGKDLSGLSDSLEKVTNPKGLDKFQQSIISFFGTDSTPVKNAKDDIDALDKSLAGLVKGGDAKLAAADLDGVIKKMKAQGKDTSGLKGQLDDYRDALADQAFEQKMAAEAMGIFGQAAVDTSSKLAEQKAAADGLRDSIIALNDVNRSAYDAQIGFESSLDSLSEAFQKNGATLDLNTDAGRKNGQAMSAAAKAHDEMLASGLASGDSLGSMTKKSEELRTSMLRLATDAFGGNTKAATEYVNTLLGVPSEIKTLITAERDEAISGLKEVQAEIAKTPGAKSVKVDTLNAAAIQALEAVGLKTKQLPDGRTQVTTKNGQALGSIEAVSRALSNLNGKTATTWTYNKINTSYSTSRSVSGGKSVHDMVGATGGTFTGKAFRYAEGGPVVGPGTGTSDDVFAPWLSNGEFVMKKTAVDKYGEKFMQLLNQGRLDLPKYAKGGLVTKAEREARSGARGDLTISRFGNMAGYKNNEFVGAMAKPDSVGSLVDALNQWRSVILKSTHGSTESRLLKQLDSAAKGLLKWEKQLGSVNKSLEKAKTKLDDLKDSAAQLKTSVKSNIISGANITKAAGADDSQVTINTVMGQMIGNASNAKQFSKMLGDLKKKGLSGDLISQIAEAGVDGGGMETAAALLGGGKAEIKRINDYQKQIAKYAGDAGKTASDAMYGAGIKAAEGLVKGLQKKQDAIEKQMLKIAKSMERSIKRALGIKSPSKVMEQVGHHTAEGFALGMTRNKSIRPAWSSMLNLPRSAPSSGRPAVQGAGSAPTVVLEIRSGGSRLDDAIVEIVRKSVRVKGGNVQSVLGA
ncbi:phage tail protein [Streptomyces sp. NPDC060011]|uniref:phage tail protein n=1 Tax=Streptomyces sp. NPDC060011 TaxID=3347037 RepID=UPI003688F801